MLLYVLKSQPLLLADKIKILKCWKSVEFLENIECIQLFYSAHFYTLYYV